MEAFVESFVDASVQIASVKASITSQEFSITPMKASMEAFMKVTTMQACVEGFVEDSVEVTLLGNFRIFHDFRGSFHAIFFGERF